MDYLEALESVKRGEAQRIAKPGQWKVWRDGAGVHSLLLEPCK